MEPRIIQLENKKLVGKNLKMSFARDRTGELWSNFMPRRKEVVDQLGNELYSLQIYSSDHFNDFDPAREFEKWALVEVADFENIPEGFTAFTLPPGLYAVFHYRGSSTDKSIFQHIFSIWLPNSPYHLDDRPHFEVLGKKYKNADPESEEEIWIPIRPK